MNNKINHYIVADSFLELPHIQTGSIDAIITDVPYDLDDEIKHYLHHQEFTRICHGVIIVFSPPENQWILPADQYLFWAKPTSTKNTSKSYSRFVEMIFIYGRLRWNYKRHWSQYTNIFTDLVDDAKIHPFRKPPALIERLILNHTNEGDLILDPFAGSGIVFDIARSLNRNCIAFEKDQSYLENRI